MGDAGPFDAIRADAQGAATGIAVNGRHSIRSGSQGVMRILVTKFFLLPRIALQRGDARFFIPPALKPVFHKHPDLQTLNCKVAIGANYRASFGLVLPLGCQGLGTMEGFFSNNRVFLCNLFELRKAILGLHN